jgi:hypothetical protein
MAVQSVKVWRALLRLAMLVSIMSAALDAAPATAAAASHM